MTREKAEQKIKEKLLEIIAIYKEYDPEGDYLALSYSEDCIFFNNRHWKSEKKIDYFESFEKE